MEGDRGFEGRLAPANEFPAETLRLVGQHRDLLRREGKNWGDYYAAQVRRQVEDRSFSGQLWLGPADEAIGLAGWELAGGLGRRAFLYLAEGYQRRAMLEEFLRRLDPVSADGLPFISWSDDVTGVAESDRAAVFSARGFAPVVRAEMRYPKEVNPPRTPPDPNYDVRQLTLTDESGIADLLLRAYAKSAERSLFATTLDQKEDARRGTQDILHGKVGRWLPVASFAFQTGHRLVALTLANELEGGLISEVAVDPDFRRLGLARRLLPLTIDALRRGGFETPRLMVTMWNMGAVRLYQQLGFEFVPGGAGRVWLNLERLGVSETGQFAP
jgi:ribosomal protein S18 acetylase RimI-like enzyme